MSHRFAEVTSDVVANAEAADVSPFQYPSRSGTISLGCSDRLLALPSYGKRIAARYLASSNAWAARPATARFLTLASRKEDPLRTEDYGSHSNNRSRMTDVFKVPEEYMAYTLCDRRGEGSGACGSSS